MAGPICMKFSGKVQSDHVGRPDSILGQFWETVRCRNANFFFIITSKWLDRFAWNFQERCVEVRFLVQNSPNTVWRPGSIYKYSFFFRWSDAVCWGTGRAFALFACSRVHWTIELACQTVWTSDLNTVAYLVRGITTDGVSSQNFRHWSSATHTSRLLDSAKPVYIKSSSRSSAKRLMMVIDVLVLETLLPASCLAQSPSSPWYDLLIIRCTTCLQ